MIKVMLGMISVLLAVIGYTFYFKDFFKGKTKPHAFSWLVWSILAGVAFFGQVIGGGGAGSWITGFTAMMSLVVFFFAIFKGEKRITLSDKLSLLGAFIALLGWYVTNDILVAVVLVTFIDGMGFYPTFRKSYLSPTEESLLIYVLASVKFVIALFALESYSLVTYLYPAYLVIVNIIFSVMVVMRRRNV